MTTHLTNATTIELSYAETSAGEGNPDIFTGIHRLEQVNSTGFGVWEVAPGVLEGVPAADEIFVVLTGSATIKTDGEDGLVTVEPGAVIRLYAGQRVRWEIQETVRKFYVHP